MSYRPKSIEDEGIDKYLNRTREAHNDFGFNSFSSLVDAGVNKANLMRAMNVKTRDTIDNYIRLYKEHKGRKKECQVERNKVVGSLQDV